MEAVDITKLSVEALNELIDRGERFYVASKDTPYNDSIWHTNYAFWGSPESEPPQEAGRMPGYEGRHLNGPSAILR